MSDQIVSLEHASRFYDAGRVRALHDVTFEITHGEFVAIVGPSGSGKSTLLHLMSGLERPSEGCVRFAGRIPASSGKWAGIRARQIGVVFQAFHLLPTLSAVENVEIPMFGVGPNAAERRRRAYELLERVGLGDRSNHRPNELSGGERQRVAIARSLANSPRLILADEPTGNLDSKASAGVMNLLTAMRTNFAATLVLATHDDTLAQQSDRLIKLIDGRVVSG